MKNLLLITILATGLYASTPIETQIAQLKATQAAQAKEIARLRSLLVYNQSNIIAVGKTVKTLSTTTPEYFTKLIKSIRIIDTREQTNFKLIGKCANIITKITEGE